MGEHLKQLIQNPSRLLNNCYKAARKTAWELQEDLAVKKLQHSMWACICEFDSSLEEPAKYVAVYNELWGCYKNGLIKCAF